MYSPSESTHIYWCVLRSPPRQEITYRSLRHLRSGMFYCKSTAQKCNATSSCQSELIALSKGLQQSLWTASYLEAQGYNREPVTVYQDNQSTIKLVKIGRSNSELTRHFWVHDLVKRGLVTIQYCPTADMIADYFTKPLQGSIFIMLRDKVMGLSPAITPLK